MKFSRLILAILAFFLSIEASLACSCGTPHSVEDAFQQSSSVFVGKVVEIKRPLMNRIGMGGSANRNVTFELKQWWKGPYIRTIAVPTRLSPEACGYSFEEGKNYLVYVVNEPKGDIQTGICTGTKNLTGAIHEVEQLNQIVGY